MVVLTGAAAIFLKQWFGETSQYLVYKYMHHVKQIQT